MKNPSADHVTRVAGIYMQRTLPHFTSLREFKEFDRSLVSREA